MSVSIVLAAVVALAIWWLSTATILILDALPRRTFTLSMRAATALLALALGCIAQTRNDLSALGAYGAFAAGIVAWGWLEMSFLMGYVTGPRKQACPAACHGWRHFVHAIQAIIHHEIATLLVIGAVIALSWHGRNQVAAQTLAILWGMRASAKLNLFLGVRNVGTELLPAHLAYLGSFFRRREMNWLFPLSVAAGGTLAAWLIGRLFAPDLTDFSITAGALLATLATLGVVEHCMLMLPLPTGAPWNWTMRLRAAPQDS